MPGTENDRKRKKKADETATPPGVIKQSKTQRQGDVHTKLYDGELYSSFFGPVKFIDRSLSPEVYEAQAAKRSGSPYVDYDTFPELAPKK